MATLWRVDCWLRTQVQEDSWTSPLMEDEARTGMLNELGMLP